MSAQEIISETVGFRLSAQQQRLFAADPQRATQCVISLDGPVPSGQLRQALELVLARHEILRTTFPRAAAVRGRTQVVHESPRLEWTVGPPPGGAAEPGDVDALLAAERARQFDLDHGPLVRARLIAAPSGSRLVLTVHAACADAQSLVGIAAEALDAYAGAPAPEPPVQFADYAEWRHEQLTGEEPPTASARAYWRAQREQAPAAPRVLFASPAAGSDVTSRIAVALTAADIARLGDAAAACGATTITFLEACWHATLARMTGADEVMLASWCDARSQPDLVGAVGPYAHAVAVLTRYGEQTTFTEVIDQVRRGRVEATARADFADAEDLEAIMGAAVAGFHDLDIPALPAPGIEVQALTAPGGALGVSCRIAGGAVHVELWHDPAVVDESDARALAGALATLTGAASIDTTTLVAQLPLVSPEQRTQLLSQSQGPPAPAPEETVHRRFERLAHTHPSAPAVASAGDQLSYGELNAAANRLAHRLRDAGVAPGASVGLCVGRGNRLLGALLGILKAGGAYVPLNHEHPAARIAHQLQESRAIVLVTEQSMMDGLPAFDGEVVCLDRDRDRLSAASAEDPAPAGGLDDLAYLMYTSGSTGAPKGVAISHRNLANYSAPMAERLIGSADTSARGLRFGVVSAISTDLGNTCTFPPLMSGGCVQLISETAAMNGELLVADLAGERLDVLKITPSHLRALIGGDRAADVLPRRVLVLGGESLDWELVARVRELAPDLRIVNHYGPTEATIGCCAYEVGERRHDSATVPIGWPLAGVRAYVLDHAGEPVPPGVPGELCIGGVGVSRGYLGDADQSAFVPDISGTGRMYRTGDRARRLRDGAVEFLGRIDDQVKVRGFRVEPAEIEAALRRHDAIRQAAVVAESDDRGDTRLVAYLASTANPTVEELQAFLADALPAYMVPSGFVMLPSLPFTASGKVDRRALSALNGTDARSGTAYVAPRDALELEIAGIWRSLLGADRVGVHDDFFALGGHSLLATQAIMRIRKLHGDVPLRALFAAPTVAALAEAVRAVTPR